MSHYLCLFDRSGAELDPRSLPHLSKPFEVHSANMSYRCQGSFGVAIGRGEGRDDKLAPFTDPKSGVTIALSGRAYMPADLVNDGHNDDLPAALASTKQLHDAFLQHGVKFLSRLSGPFVVMILDPRQNTMTVVRSHLGDLKLYYYLDKRWFVVASEPVAILRHAAVTNDIDESAVARFLGFHFSQTPSSFFQRIKELAPAHWLKVTANTSQCDQYWRFNNQPDIRTWSKEQVCDGFRKLLGQSLVNQMIGTQPDKVALSMSGGLDSTTLAALAPSKVRLLSWYFEDTPDCDEQHNIRTVAEYLDRPVRWVPGDGLNPLCQNYIERFVHKNSPYLNAFAALKYRLYRTAREEGCEQILVGDAGDVIYAAKEYWLRDLLIHRQPGSYTSLVNTIRKAARGSKFAQLSLRRLLPVRHIRAVFGRGRPIWLTETACRILPKEAPSPILPLGAHRYRFDPGVGVKHVELESEEQQLFVQCGVVRGNPYWHWPLLEFVLNLPAFWYHRDGLNKILPRVAMKGLLPPKVLKGGPAGMLGSFFLRGMEMNKNRIREAVFVHPRSDWRRYVDPTWVEPYLSATRSIAFGHTILWRVISYELWYRCLIGDSSVGQE